jgi:hypothetical protein
LSLHFLKSLLMLDRFCCFIPVSNFRSFLSKYILMGLGCQPHAEDHQPDGHGLSPFTSLALQAVPIGTLQLA